MTARHPALRPALAALAACVPASLLLATTGPAGAEPCAAVTTLEQRADAADDVFSGTVESHADADTKRTYTVTVDRVYKGQVSTRRVDVTTSTAKSGCGLPKLPTGDDYVFFTDESGGELMATGRNGTRAATASYVARVEDVLGDGRPVVAPDPEPVADVTFSTVGDPAPDAQRLAAPGLALALVGLLGLLLASWRGRRLSSR